MPGRVSMDQQGVVNTPDLKKDRSHAQQGSGGQQATGMGVQPVAGQQSARSNGPVNDGHNGALPNGVRAPNGNVPTSNGDHMDTITAAAGPSNPPELDGSWREGPSNKSLGKLVDRLAQQCYHDLNKTLTKMAEVGADQSDPQTNGVLTQSQHDNSEASLKKKRLLMDFAHDQRDRFTKTLVLADWARNEEEMGKLIDIKVWQDKQRFAYANAAMAVGETKRKILGFKVPAPNIEGAMELLATGKASWVPDLGYIPPKRLTAKQLLKTLKGMNVTLATRLSLHVELPPYMQDFTVANGRATFTVATEFEVDLSVADEDPTSPWYFIDIRFLFIPNSGGTLHDQLRGHLEGRANEFLAARGLQGCYDFLHNFVLTHKINTLRGQAQELVKCGKWVDCIKVEYMRRSLVVQYWAGMPGPKNWFEIGIGSGKQKPGSRKPPTPRLSIRWFRKGREVFDEHLDFNVWAELDLEACLSRMIAKHCFGKLSAAESDLQRSLQHGSRLVRMGRRSLDHGNGERVEEGKEPKQPPSYSQQDAAEGSALTIHLPAMRSPLVVRVEQVTGQVCISPASAASLSSERALNSNDPKVDFTGVLASLACQVVQEQVQKQAELLGWQEVRNLASVRAKFGADVLQRSIFFVPGWGRLWALAVSFSLGSEKWWVVQLTETKPDERSQRVLKDVSNVRELGIPEITAGRQGTEAATYTQSSLLRIERSAVAEVSYSLLSEQLGTLRIPHHIEKPTIALTGDGVSAHSTSSTPSARVFVQFSPLMRDKRDKAWKAWAADSVRLTLCGLEDAEATGVGEVGRVRYDIRLSIQPGKMKHLQQHPTRSSGQDIAINATGGMAVRLRTPFGEPFIERIQKRLRSIERLDRYVAVLQKLDFTCTSVGLTRLAFTYSTAPQLSAELSFTSDGDLPVRLRLEPADSNPHLRVRVMLEQGLNGKDPAGFSNFAHTLALTLPLLRTFERLESAHLEQRSFTVRKRSATWYSIAYKAPLPACTFELRARAKEQGAETVIRWHLHQAKSKPDTPAVPETLASALKAFWQEKDEHWFGIGNGGIVADSLGIPAAVEKLDELIQRNEGWSAYAPAADAAPAAPVAQMGGANQGSGSGQKQPAAKPAPVLRKAQPPAKKGQPQPDVIMLD